MAGVTEDDVRKAIEYVKKKNAGFLKEAKAYLEELLPRPKKPARTLSAVGTAARKLEELTYKYKEMLAPGVSEAARAARETLEALSADMEWGDRLDEGSVSVRRIQESLEGLKASMPEYPDFDRVYARVARTSAGKDVSEEECKQLYDRIIQERWEKAAKTKRGRPLLRDQKKPTLDDVRKIVEKQEKAEGLFPESGPVLAEAKGTREVGKKHYAAIREERERAADGDELRKLDKLIRDNETTRKEKKNVRDEAQRTLDEAQRAFKESDAEWKKLLEKRRKLLTRVATTSFMLPGSAAPGGYEAALRALEERIAAVKAARDAALRRVEELEAELRAQA